MLALENRKEPQVGYFVQGLDLPTIHVLDILLLLHGLILVPKNVPEDTKTRGSGLVG